MFLPREIDIKLCRNYTKIRIFAILYNICSIKPEAQLGLFLGVGYIYIFKVIIAFLRQ